MASGRVGFAPPARLDWFLHLTENRWCLYSQGSWPLRGPSGQSQPVGDIRLATAYPAAVLSCGVGRASGVRLSGDPTRRGGKVESVLTAEALLWLSW